MTRVASALSLKGRALRLLSGREHSRSRARAQARLARGRARASWRRVLDELQAKGFIDHSAWPSRWCTGARAKLGAAAHPPGTAGQGPRCRSWWRRPWPVFARTELQRAREVWRRNSSAPPADAARARQAGALPGGARLRRRRDPACAVRHGGI